MTNTLHAGWPGMDIKNKPMPHFIIDCSPDILQQQSADELMQLVYEAAEATGLFAKNDIKVRIRAYEHFRLADGKTNFIHIFGYIMEGRTTEQKANLSRLIISRLSALQMDTSFLSINISDFERATYCNQSQLSDSAGYSNSK